MAPSTPSPPRLHALPTLLADFEATTAALQATHGQLTEQVAQLHAQLSTAQMRMQMLLESLSAAVIVVHDERVLHFNRASRKWLPDLGLGQRWQLPAHWQAGPSPGEYRLPREQGAVTLLVEQSSHLDMQVVHIQDISQAMEEQQQAARTRRWVAMGHMSAGIAHQIRTPLATAVLYASHLMQDQLTPAQRQHCAQRLRQQLLSLEGLLSQMLRLARNEPLHLRPIRAHELLAQVCDQVQAQSQARSVPLRVCGGDTAQAPLMVDPVLLVSALSALVENAIEASPCGQEVTLSVRQCPHACELEIRDQGAGIDPSHLEHLFEPFHTTRRTGTGLGLPMAQQIVQAHAGDIVYTPGAGACFVVRLPSVPCTTP